MLTDFEVSSPTVRAGANAAVRGIRDSGKASMLVLVTYDVSTVTKAGARRLRRVARACKDYGQRVQKSVFECKVERKDWIVFKDRLLNEINETQDSLRFYFLDVGVMAEHYGIKEPLDWEAPLIL